MQRYEKPNFECPKCGGRNLRVRGRVDLYYDSESQEFSTDFDTITWDSGSICICQDCDHDGELETFKGETS